MRYADCGTVQWPLHSCMLDHTLLPAMWRGRGPQAIIACLPAMIACRLTLCKSLHAMSLALGRVPFQSAGLCMPWHMRALSTCRYSVCAALQFVCAALRFVWAGLQEKGFKLGLLVMQHDPHVDGEGVIGFGTQPPGAGHANGAVVVWCFGAPGPGHAAVSCVHCAQLQRHPLTPTSSQY